MQSFRASKNFFFYPTHCDLLTLFFIRNKRNKFEINKIATN